MSTCTTLNQGWVLDFRALSQNRRKLPQNNVQLVICHLHNIWSWNRASCPCVCSRYIKKELLYFTHAAQTFYLFKAI